MRNLSIKRKLNLLSLASSTVALLLVATGFVSYQLYSFRTDMTDDLATTAKMVGDQSTAIMALPYGGTEADARGILDPLSAKEHIVAACLYRGTNICATPYFRDKSNPQAVPNHPGADGWQFDFAQGRLSGFQHVWLNGEDVGAVYLQSDLGQFYSLLRRYLVTFAWFIIISSLVVYLLSSRLQRVITRPIFDLAQTAKTVSADKDYSVRARRESNDELGQLIDGFNDMLAQIQERDVALHNANDELERRVWARTRDLQSENAERKRAEEALQQQLKRISLLNDITYAATARQDSDSIILIVLQQLEDHLPIDYGSAYRFDTQTETLTAMVRGPKTRPLAEQLRIPPVIPLNDTPFRPCVQGEMVYVPDTARLDLPVAQKAAHEGTFSLIGTPLMVEGKMFGLLVFMRRKADRFSEAERDFIRGLSAHVAVAVHQAQLYQDLQKAYNELRQTQQAIMQQERLKALGQMASGIAHDVNNALSPIVGFAELIDKKEPHLSAESRRHLQHIKTAGEDIAHIVARLREFYRQRDEEERLLALNLNRMADQVVDMMRPRWRDIPQGRGIMIEVRKDLDPQLPQVAGIESEIREVLTNLILNAVDALPHGGAITLRTRQTKLNGAATANGASEHAILEVSDTGIGMDEKTRKHCLEPFFSTKGPKGTGLGLAMVYGVVERHEGQIEIESEPGKGTTMRLIFPVRKIEAADTTSRFSNEPIPPLRILCLDDEPMLRELLLDMLTRDGHTVEVAEGGETGVKAFRAARERGKPFDVVITDLGMPYLDGREVAKILKRESPETPVVMLTGWGTFMKDEGNLPPQIDGILSKPPQLGDVRAMLRRVTRHVRKAQPVPVAQGA